MTKFSCLFFYFLILQSVSAESDLELEVMGQLNILEDMVYFPINLYLSSLSTQFETIASNLTNYQTEAKNVIEVYSQTITDNIDEILDTYREAEIDTTTCAENLEENIDQIVKTGDSDVMSVILEGVTQGQKIIADAQSVFMVVQNKTIEVRLIVQNCMSLLDDSECLMGALSQILIMKQTINKVITSNGVQHETRMDLLEDEVVADLEKVVVGVFGKYVEILDGFLTCIVQQQLL